MHHSPTPLHPHYSSQQPTNKRSQSLFEHISPASRQTLQQINSNETYHRPQYHQYQSNGVLQREYKENRVVSKHPYDYEANLKVQSSQLKAQNDLLREELQKQRAKYEGEIAKLKKNITFKDQLLDECEQQIGTLRNTYKQLISQFQQINAHQSGREHGSDLVISSHQHKQVKEGRGTSREDTSRRNQTGREGGLIPLSLVGGGTSRSGSSGGKMTHGLMRGRG